MEQQLWTNSKLNSQRILSYIDQTMNKRKKSENHEICKWLAFDHFPYNTAITVHIRGKAWWALIHYFRSHPVVCNMIRAIGWNSTCFSHVTMITKNLQKTTINRITITAFIKLTCFVDIIMYYFNIHFHIKFIYSDFISFPNSIPKLVFLWVHEHFLCL